MLSYKLTTFTADGRTHEAVCVAWSDVDALLGHEHRGTPEDDQRIKQALLEAGAPGWASEASGATDERGWYLLGPEVAEPLLESELEDFSDDHVVIGDEIYAAETDEQIDAVARMLHRLGMRELPVYRGAQPDTIKTSLVIVPRA